MYQFHWRKDSTNTTTEGTIEDQAHWQADLARYKVQTQTPLEQNP